MTITLVLVALSVGLSNFAASIGMGITGVDMRLRLEIGVVFGVFETGMPVVGVLLGQQVSSGIGSESRWVGAGLLMLTGLYGIARERFPRTHATRAQPNRLLQLLVAGLALSIDNLAIGFALGTNHVNLLLTVVVIGAGSVSMSLIGLEIGRHLGERFRFGAYGELLGNLVLVAVGVAIATGVL